MPVPNDSLFGTDGIRGRWGVAPLDAASIECLGSALDMVMGPCRLLVGEDPRESSSRIRDHLLRGMSPRQQVATCGVIPTPGLSWGLRTGEWDWGIMITASHNPWMDNGIKLFAGDGTKADDRTQELVTAAFRRAEPKAGSGARQYRCQVAHEYATELRKWGADLNGNGISLVVDAANGAAAKIAPSLFSDLGYLVDMRGANPDGRNINENCGATHVETIQSAVRETGADLGVTLDGDGDRVLFVDCRGGLITGDHVLFALAGGMRKDRSRCLEGVVGTVMSNLGLELELTRRKIAFLRAPVGDRHVARVMREAGFILGGEPSGHTIYSPLQPTGDGLLTTLLFLGELGNEPAAAATRLCREMTWFAQETRSIHVEKKRDLDTWPELKQFKVQTLNRYGDRVRLLTRYSGTEPKLRLMAEAETEDLVRSILDELEALVGNDHNRDA
ncbi:MAG TPA: phosphoglucosamine mutase [Candidatus Aminicenantes bacterium]|nr:phosphoglucosamine mutase [Candidatus Aminicenantes bacterium]